MPPVTVNLGVNVDASGTINVFGAPFTGVNNEVVSGVRPSASLIYKGSNADGAALFQFQGNTADPDTIDGRLNDTFMLNAPYGLAINSALNGVINGPMNASAAAPFSSSVYAADAINYRNFNTFGDLSLAAYAHYLFGHVQATAAIDNDEDFVAYMNSNVEGTGATIASRLFAALLACNPTNVARQVIGQDASRARNVDNTDPSPSAWQNLEFKENDVVYFNITLQRPVAVTYTAGQTSAPARESVNVNSYAIKVTLSA
jgi:hypothetical protein